MEQTRKRLLILITIDILISAAILLGTSYVRSSSVLSHRLEQQAELRAEKYAQELGGWIKGYIGVIETIANDFSIEHVTERSDDEIHQYLKRHYDDLNKDGDISDIYYTDIHNKMTCASEFADQGSIDYVHEREWFVNAAEGTDVCISSPYMDSMEDRVVVTLSKAVRSGELLLGVFCADIYLDTLINKINQAEVDGDSYAFLVDSSYEMVVHPCRDFDFEGEPKSITDTKSVDYSGIKTQMQEREEDVLYIRDYDGVERGFTMSVIPEVNWFVGIATSKSTLMKDVRSLTIVFLIAGMAALVVGIIFIIVFTARFMKYRKVSTKEAVHKFGIKNILLSMAAVLFFVALIIMYVAMLYSSSKEAIMARGELHSVESANSLNKYISQSSSIVHQSQYELDKMLENKCTQEEIREYVVSKTETVQRTLDKNYTGLYAYIDGKYYDGAGWIPDKGWVATERPWYKKAIGANGKIALVEPYLDAQTGLLTMTVALAMNDRKNVVAIDVAFEMMKTVTEETSEEADRVEMVLDSAGNVIAHSDDKEIGKNYTEEKDSLGGAVTAKLFETNDQCFELEYDGVEYVVYSVNMGNEWYSVTLIDSKESYRPLSMLVIATVFIIILTVTILLLIFINISSKSIALERINAQLTAASQIYVVAYDIDMKNDSWSDLHFSERVNKYIEKEELKDSAKSTLVNVTGTVTMADTHDAAVEFVDLETLDERMKEIDTLAMEFHIKDGRWLRGRFIVSERTEDGRISHVLWMVENVDDEKRRRDKLRDMSARAIAESEAKSAFLSNMSHEIRTPITAVLGMNEMILRECEDENVRNYAESIETAGHTLLGLVNDILDFSKIEAGKMEIIPVEYELASVLNDLVNMTQIRADKKGLLLRLDFEPRLPKVLYGDEVRIKQIITNVLTNAVKYTEKGTVTFSVRYERVSQDSDEIRIVAEVRDTGIGIREEAMNKLFARFERIEEMRNRNIEGTGLGMTITKHLLDLMHGTMEVESEYGKGSCFTIKLRQKVIDWDPIGDYQETFKKHIEEKGRYRQLFTAPDAKILVVDDTKMNQTVMKSLLKCTEVQIDSAMNGDDGLVLMKKEPYDIIFLDHMMPVKDGIETLREFREANEGPNLDTPVICLTANAISGAREMYMKEGFDSYLTKPIDSSKLENMLVSYIPKNKIRFVDEDEAPVTEEESMEEEERMGEETTTVEDLEDFETDEEIDPLYLPHEGIDLQGALEGMGSLDTFMPVLDIFYESIDENSAEIDEKYHEEDWEYYTILVHALKSSARIVGAADLGEEAFAMEMAGKNEDVDYIRANHETLLEHYRAFKEILSDIYEGEDTDPADLPEANEDMIANWYARIRTGAEEMDIGTLDGVFAEVKEYLLPEKDREKMKEIRHMAEEFEYDEILGIFD